MLGFLKYVFATLVALFLFVLIFFGILIGISAGGEKAGVTIAENSILKLSFEHKIVERDVDNPFSEAEIPFLSNESSIGLDLIKKSLDAAAKDPKIKGIYLETNGIQAGLATAQEIREALVKFKKSGKFIYAYGDAISEGAYYLYSVADKIYLNPIGEFEFNGLSSEGIFIKGTLEKLEIRPEIFKVGEYKSAVETFTSDKMSPADKEQTNSFLNSIYGFYLKNVAESRKMDIVRLKVISDSMLVHNANDALKLGMVDGLKYYDEVEDELRKKTKVDGKEKLKFVGLKRYAATLEITEEEEKTSKNKVAVIYADGDIVMGNGDDNSIGSDKLSAEIRKARKDESVKAVVLRINSPGGSALASDIIWREVYLTQKSKPIIASMSNVAASGGYYIAMACDTIVAQPNSVTGSIGVFGVLLNMKNFLKNKLGITTDRVNTGYFSDLPNATRDLSAFEKKSIQSEVESIYDVFTKKAAEGRGISQDSLKKLASGRVWSGLEAKQNGLIDELGGLELAIKIAVNKAKLGKDYELVNYPEDKKFIEKIMSTLSGDAETQLEKELGTEARHHFETLKKVKSLQGVQARMPYEMVIQ